MMEKMCTCKMTTLMERTTTLLERMVVLMEHHQQVRCLLEAICSLTERKVEDMAMGQINRTAKGRAAMGRSSSSSSSSRSSIIILSH